MLLMAILIAAVGVAVVIPGCLILENDKSALALLIGALLITIANRGYGLYWRPWA